MRTFLANLMFDIQRQWQFFSIRFDNYMQFGTEVSNWPVSNCRIHKFAMFMWVDERSIQNVRTFEEHNYCSALGQIGNQIIAIRNWS